MHVPAPSGKDDPLDLTVLLARLVGELEGTALRCTTLQWSISTLLEKVHHPDLAEEIHMLQDIDGLQQTLADIAAVLRVASEVPDRVSVSRETIGAAIRLESFRSRIGLGSAASADADVADSDITWL